MQKQTTSIVRVGRNFQVTIPAEIRKSIPVVEGDYIETFAKQGQIIFSPIDVVKKRTIQDKDEKEWNDLVVKQFLAGYDSADSAYDKL